MSNPEGEPKKTGTIKDESRHKQRASSLSSLAFGTIRLSSTGLNGVAGIPHKNLETMNLVTPCTCDYCDKFIWGLYKQASHCTECGHYYHVDCARYAVNDCHLTDRGIEKRSSTMGSKKDIVDSAHLFNAITYTYPTWCKVCNKFIWGLALQGFRCKRCDLDSHKNCIPAASSLPCLSLSGGTLQVLKIPLMVVDADVAKNVIGRRTDDPSHQAAFKRESKFRLNQPKDNSFMKNMARASLMILPQIDSNNNTVADDESEASTPVLQFERDNSSFLSEVNTAVTERLEAMQAEANASNTPTTPVEIIPSSSSSSIASLKSADSIPWQKEVEILEDFVPQNSKYTLADFEISDKELGRGQFGIVKEAYNKVSKTRMAVKIIEKKRFWGRRPESARHLKREIAILSQLKHPGVINLYAVFDEREQLFMFMELVEGGDLLSYVEKKGRISEDEAKFLFHQLAVGVKYLHDRGVVHRDLKPENLLLSIEDNVKRVKIADFGFANIMGSKSFLRSVVGTPAYVAPEILNKNNNGYTKAADLWSIGVILYACLGGVFPFDENEPVEDQILAGKFNFPNEYFGNISDLGIDICCNLLMVDPRQRFTVDDMLRHAWLKVSDQRPLSLPTES